MPDEKRTPQQQTILDIAKCIAAEMHVMPTIETSKKGRDGKRLVINVPKEGIGGVEAIYVHGELYLGIAIKDDITSKIVQDFLNTNGFKLKIPQKNPRYEYSFKSLCEAYHLLINCDELDDVAQLHAIRNNRLVKPEYSPKKIYERYKFAIEHNDYDLLKLGRKLLSADNYDADISINIRSKRTNYREHIVPCTFIHYHLIDCISDISENNIYTLRTMSCTEENAIIKLIEDNLKIAYITEDEAKIIDGHLGLRTTMPMGWEWGDDIEARLNLAKIQVTNRK